MRGLRANYSVFGCSWSGVTSLIPSLQADFRLGLELKLSVGERLGELPARCGPVRQSRRQSRRFWLLACDACGVVTRRGACGVVVLLQVGLFGLD